MARLETFERYTNKQGKISYKAKFIAWAEAEKIPNVQKKYRNVQRVPCGQCIECRIAQARNNAAQCYAEFKTSNKNECWFLTLTYNDEHLPLHTTIDTTTGELFEGISLSKKDAQNFIKLLRYYYPDRNIRYMISGEYGEETKRPHMHAIIFNLPLDDLKPWGANEAGQKYFRSKRVEEIWGKGQVIIGAVTFDSMNYTARYVEKKILGKDAKWYYQSQGKIPEFCLKSKKPPLGYEYYQKNKDRIYETDEFNIATDKAMKTFKPPKSFDRMYEKENPEAMEKIKIKRKAVGEAMEQAKMSKSDKDSWQQRIDGAERKERKFKKLQRKEL